MHLNFYHIAGALLPERFLHKNMRRCDNFTTQQSQRFTLKKGPWSFRMPEIHLLLLSGSVRSVWKDSSEIFFFYICCKGFAACSRACLTLSVAIFVYALYRSQPRLGFRRADYEYSLRMKYAQDVATFLIKIISKPYFV